MEITPEQPKPVETLGCDGIKRYEARRVEHQCCIHCAPDAHAPHTFDGCPRPEPELADIVTPLVNAEVPPHTVLPDHITKWARHILAEEAEKGMKRNFRTPTLYEIVEQFNKEYPPRGANTEPPQVGLCVLCYTSLNPPVDSIARYVVGGIGVCREHVDQAIEES
jgi:hypothetical protein